MRDRRFEAEEAETAPRKRGAAAGLAFALWIVAAVMALHLGNPAQDLNGVAWTAASADEASEASGLAASDQPSQPIADLRSTAPALGTESRTLVTKSGPHVPGFDDAVGHGPCGPSCMAFGDAAHAPPAPNTLPAAVVARAFQSRAPPSVLV